MASTPLAGGIVNGIGHAWGYRNYECKDRSRNLVPARFRRRWFEVDVGWIYIKALSWSPPAAQR